MTSREISTSQVFFTLVLAAVFWYLIFSAQLFNFWLSMAVAASVLAGLAVLCKAPGQKRFFSVNPVAAWAAVILCFVILKAIPFPVVVLFAQGKSILFISPAEGRPCS